MLLNIADGLQLQSFTVALCDLCSNNAENRIPNADLRRANSHGGLLPGTFEKVFLSGGHSPFSLFQEILLSTNLTTKIAP